MAVPIEGEPCPKAPPLARPPRVHTDVLPARLTNLHWLASSRCHCRCLRPSLLSLSGWRRGSEVFLSRGRAVENGGGGRGGGKGEKVYTYRQKLGQTDRQTDTITNSLSSPPPIAFSFSPLTPLLFFCFINSPPNTHTHSECDGEVLRARGHVGLQEGDARDCAARGRAGPPLPLEGEP